MENVSFGFSLICIGNDYESADYDDDDIDVVVDDAGDDDDADDDDESDDDVDENDDYDDGDPV